MILQKKTKSLVKNVTESWSGVIPCADCPGINYKLILNSDYHYTERRRYLEKAFTETGQWAITVDFIVKIIHKELGLL
ncbi:copper resistance protein NlpE [Aliifodinibius sp. S!AR15-10]|uniref:copper resistance protein NlpE N-terminal domain-containing protein n=1 Tax=Aliifodinibius sp. S!AR15-10 TaxID=2950437 RepID=UPI0028559F7A|nr:copper resistance protein NlpE N-terminal domain-containing protein [Aliifodinibius sp. S!AR15-10]MDR8390013.1 copper resistance protein NlpE [Aliifodinibius sp. S!AR15-10]